MNSPDFQKEKWDTYYGSNPLNQAADYDDWIEKYYERMHLSEQSNILDLGCGLCAATQFFFDKPCRLTCADYSENAIAHVKRTSPDAETFLMDLREALPFPILHYDLIIADLSLHYFHWETTQRIFADIYRILKHDGTFLLRLNSVNDTLHGAGEGEEIEKNFFLLHNQYKRFFDQEAIDALLAESWLYDCQEKAISRKGMSKMLWEIEARKT